MKTEPIRAMSREQKQSCPKCGQLKKLYQNGLCKSCHVAAFKPLRSFYEEMRA